MGWTAYYQVLRDRPFSATELARLSAHVAAANRPRFEVESFWLRVAHSSRPDRVVAYGITKVPHSPSETDARDDHDRLCVALTQLAALFPDVELRLGDDYDVFAWDPVARVASLEGTTGAAPIELGDPAGFEDLFRIAPPPPVVTDGVSELLAGARQAGAELADTLVALATLPNDHPQQAPAAERLARLPPADVVNAGLAVYADIAARAVWHAVRSALEALPDVTPFRSDFLAIWTTPRGMSWFGDLSFPDAALATFARDPRIEARLCTDVRAAADPAAPELAHRRAEVAARILGRGCTAAGITALIETARALRDQPLASNQRYYSMPGVYGGLADSVAPAVAPTLLLETLAGELDTRHRVNALKPLARIAPRRIGPVLCQLARDGELLADTVDALQLAAATERDDATLVDALHAVAALPTTDRERAVRVLEELGHRPPAQPPLPPPETLLAHPARAIRARAIDDLDRRLDPTLVRALCLGDALDNAIRRDPHRRWLATLERFADDIRRAPLPEQLRWLDALQCPLPPQQSLPALAPVAGGALEALAATYTSTWPRLDAASRAGLIAEETAILAALHAGTLDPRDRGATLPAPTPLALVDAATEQVPDATAQIDALLDGLVGADLPWEQTQGARAELLKLPPKQVVARVLARFDELVPGSLGSICDQLFPQVIGDAALEQAIAEAWEDGQDLANDHAGRYTSQVSSVAGCDALFGRALEEVAAPDMGELRRKTWGAFDLLGAARSRREAATAALVAKLRAARGRSRDIVAWREQAWDALRGLGSPSAHATALLECAELANAGALDGPADCLAALGDASLDALLRLFDLPRNAVRVAKAICRARAAERPRYLAHPFYRVQLAATASIERHDAERAHLCSIHAELERRGIPVPPDEVRWARPHGYDETTPWLDLARTFGGPVDVPPAADPLDGAASRCADFRAWALWALDERAAPADLAARVFADELDRELAVRGLTRVAPRWRRWRAHAPDLPRDRTSRLAWAMRSELELPADLQRVRDLGAAAVAAEIPGPMLDLTPIQRAQLEATESAVAALGDELLTGGLAARTRFDASPVAPALPVPFF